jgi:hypothetical protein
LARHPDRVSAWQADAIVPAPLGTYPFGSNVLTEDLAWLESYSRRLHARRGESGGDFAAARALIAELLFLDGDEDAFLEGVGVRRLRELMA